MLTMIDAIKIVEGKIRRCENAQHLLVLGELLEVLEATHSAALNDYHRKWMELDAVGPFEGRDNEH